jgi:peptide/nickel transport system ATP-binding protein
MLEINNLSIEFPSANGATRAVDGISFVLNKGETLGIVGESGSGKSVTALSVMRLLPEAGKITSGEILLQQSTINNRQSPINLLSLPEPSLPAIRGTKIAMIFQEPMTSLNPVFRCGQQVTEAIRLHQKVSIENAKSQTIKLFERVRLPDTERIFNAYPHQLSGGQKQRVMIAMAMSCRPKILIADEPTTALDVTVQKAILDLMRELKEENGLSMLFISHDLGVISEICDRVAVMFQGKIVEEGAVEKILQNPEHPYTKGLVACRPSIHRKLWRIPTVPDFLENKNFETRLISSEETAARREAIYAQAPVLQVNNLTVRYPKKKNWLGQPVEWLNAVDRVSFEVFPGEAFGLAGESGCGKTTLGRAIARLTTAYAGEIFYAAREPSSPLPPSKGGQDLRKLSEEQFRPYRREIQVVFQDPYSSLNPRLTAGEAITEPMRVHQLFENEKVRREKAVELLETVGLQAEHFSRYPHEFSGGQRQRICLARALAVEPKLLVCDEIVSSLDVSVQATVLNLLMDLQEKFGLTYLFISHDLSVIKQMCDRLLVMNQGKIEALGFPEDIFEKPQTEYVQRLVAAIPGKN